MSFLASRVKLVMLVCGALTCTMLTTALAPARSMLSSFGEPLVGDAAALVVRSWGILIVLVGAMLIYGAFVPVVRPLVLTVAGISKLCFVLLVLAQGARYLGQPIRVAVVADSIMVLLFAVCLVAEASARSSS